MKKLQVIRLFVRGFFFLSDFYLIIYIYILKKLFLILAY
jgi:hypothetical protein